MKKLLSLLLLVVLGFAFIGCGQETTTEAEGTQTTEEAQIKIGANIYSFTDNFMNGAVKPALVEYAAEQGVDLQIVDSENNQAKLNEQVDSFILPGVDVLAINLVDPAAAPTIINKAKDADIPLIIYNKESTIEGAMASYDKVWYVGTASKDAGIIQGEMMMADWNANPSWDKNGDGQVQYVLLKGETGHPDAEARTEWAVKTFTDAGITMDQLAIQDSSTWNTAEAKNTMDAWITNFGDTIELVISNNDGMAFGAITAMADAGVSYPVYGVDALAQALVHIQNDELNGTVLNDAVNQAKATLDLAINAAKGLDVLTGTEWTIDDLATTKAVRVPYVAVTKDNVSDYMA